MLSRILFIKQASILFILINSFTLPIAKAQTVGLDNWYNNETNANNGIAEHYYWTNTGMSGYSEWGELFTDKGAVLTTLQRPDSASLSNIDVYIIVDPDTTSENASPNYILPNDITAIEKWVNNGGVLVLLGNDAKNCEFTHFNQLSSHFGITFNYVTLHTDNATATSANLPNHFIFKDVTTIFLKGISTIEPTGSAESVLTEGGKTLMAESKYGQGMVFAIGDPWIYNEYINTNDNMTAAKNLTDYLLHDTATVADTSTTTTAIDKISSPKITVYPNPTSGKIVIETNRQQTNCELIIKNVCGETVALRRYDSRSKYYFDLTDMPSGIYFIQCITDNETLIKRVLKQ